MTPTGSLRNSSTQCCANSVVLDRGPDGKHVYVTGASIMGFDPVGVDSNIDAAMVAYFDPFD